MTGRAKMVDLMAESDAAVMANLRALLTVAEDQLEIEQYEDDADLRRRAARYASVLSTYIASGLLPLDRAMKMMRTFIRTGVEELV